MTATPTAPRNLLTNPPAELFSTSESALAFLKLAARADSPIAVDTEANGADIRDSLGFACGVSLAFRVSNSMLSGYLPFRHGGSSNLDRLVLLKLKDLLESSDRLIFHNAKFDLVSLATLGINYSGEFYDTMLMAHMIDENTLNKGLDYLSQLYLKDPGKKRTKEFLAIVKTFGWMETPPEYMAEYAAYDAELTLRLYEHLLPEFKKQELDGELWEIEQRFVRLLIRMEGRGIRINQELCQEQAYLGQVRMVGISEKLGLNPASPKDLEKLLLEELKLPVVKETPGGRPSFDKDAMQRYESMLSESGDSRASMVLEYRGWQKTVSSNYLGYITLLGSDGRLRPSYKMHGTVTGRLSCEQPNLQQIPRTSKNPWNGNLKKAFIADKGYTLWEADYGQLELRLGTAYAKIDELLDAFNEGRDVFTEMANELDMERFEVKTLTYTIQYGGGAKRIASVFGVSEERAKEIRENYYEQYPGFRKMTMLCASRCKTRKYLKLWTGRRRHFIDPDKEAHKAFNSLIQGGAAELVKRAMLKLADEVDSEECRMLLQIHDSVVFEIKQGREDYYLPKIESIMADSFPEFGVKFAVDIHQWGE